MIRLSIAALREAEPDRWPGYAESIIDAARAGKATVTAETLVLPDGLWARIAERVIRPAKLDDALRLTLAAVVRVPWPRRGPLLWMALRDHPTGSKALVDAVTPLVDAGGCACRNHWGTYLRDHPPVFGNGWSRWVWSAHNAVNARRGVAQMPWEREAARRTLADRFGAVRVISLVRTPGRLDDFYARLPSDWPLALPTVFTGLDGAALRNPQDVPAGWRWRDANMATIGCRASWLAVLDDLAGTGRPALVMEDDCQFAADAVGRLAATMDALPDGWELLYLGGEHNATPKPFAPGLVRVTETGRTHAMVVHPRYVAPMRAHVAGYPSHIDWGLRELAKRDPSRQFYAADPFVAIQGANWSTLRNQHEPPRGFDARVKAPPGRPAGVLSHGGDVGDLIYALPVIRAAGRELGGADVVLSPLAGTRRAMTPELVAEVAPLLLAQPYVRSVRYADAPEGFDLNAWRRRRYPGLYNLADRQLDLLDWSHAERDAAWLAVDPSHVADVIVHRSPRYHNPRMDWRAVLDRYAGRLAVVGSPEEHAELERTTGVTVPYHPTADYLALARVIAGAKLFVGNQSSPLALSIGLGVPVVVERSTDLDNCHFDRPDATYVTTGQERLPDLPT